MSSTRLTRSKRARDEESKAAADEAQQQAQAEDERKQPDAGSLSAQPRTRRARIAVAASAAPATSMAAAAKSAARTDDVAVAASSAQRSRLSASAFVAPSPAARLDLDSLSVVFSFLNTADFLASIRVCRQWRAARMRHTAWPTFNLPSFIQSLRDDNYDDPARRRLRLQMRAGNMEEVCNMLDGGQAGAGAGAAAAHAASIWHNATDAQIVCTKLKGTYSYRPQRNCDDVLQHLVQLPYLAALNCNNVGASPEQAQQLFTVLNVHLQAALLFNSPKLSRELRLLSGLRVLVLRGFLSAESLLPLHRLVYLHYDSTTSTSHVHKECNIKFGRVLRHLSAVHSLRALSIDSGHALAEMLIPRELEPEEQAPQTENEFISAELRKLPPVDADKPLRLHDLTIHSIPGARMLHTCLERLPCLTRLQAECAQLSSGGYDPWAQVQMQMFPESAEMPLEMNALAALTHIRLDFFDRGGGARPRIDWSHVERCTRLRSLQVACRRDEQSWSQTFYLRVVSAVQLQRVLAANSATLEELRLDSSLRLANDDSDNTYAWSQGARERKMAAREAAFAAAASGWKVLAECVKLRELELPLERDTPPELFAALSSAPAFLSLTLSEVTSRLLSSSLLQSMASSRSWCGLRLRGSSLKLTADDLEDLLPAAQVEASSARRMRVYVYHGRALTEDASFGIRADESGATSWQEL